MISRFQIKHAVWSCSHMEGGATDAVRGIKQWRRSRARRISALLFDLLTPNEEIEDAYSGHLRLDIPLLSRRLAVVTKAIEESSHYAKSGLGLFRASTGGIKNSSCCFSRRTT